MFLALTFIIIIILILIMPDIGSALIVIGLMIAFCGALLVCGGAWAPMLAGRFQAPPGDEISEPQGGPMERYKTVPSNPPPHPAMSMTRAPDDDSHYPGSIDADDWDTEGADGHRDLTEGDAEGVPYGNPFNTGRVAYPPSGEACVDDEANDAEMDGDELNAYQATSRNDATRVTAGTMNRRRDLDKHLREEAEESEDRFWWGRHEE